MGTTTRAIPIQRFTVAPVRPSSPSLASFAAASSISAPFPEANRSAFAAFAVCFSALAACLAALRLRIPTPCPSPPSPPSSTEYFVLRRRAMGPPAVRAAGPRRAPRARARAGVPGGHPARCRSPAPPVPRWWATLTGPPRPWALVRRSASAPVGPPRPRRGCRGVVAVSVVMNSTEPEAGLPGARFRASGAQFRRSGEHPGLSGEQSGPRPVLLDAAVTTRCRRRVHLEHDPDAGRTSGATPVDEAGAAVLPEPDPGVEMRVADAAEHRAALAARFADLLGASYRRVPDGPRGGRGGATLAPR